MRLRMIKSAEEIAHITEMARIADIGGAACVEATKVGVPEHEVALHSTATMVREIAKSWPHGELMDTWTWFQSGINTDGAHNPVTSRKIERGDILSRSTASRWWRATTSRWSARCSPKSAATSTSAVEHQLCGARPRQGAAGAGQPCSDIAKELNEMYAAENLLQYRSFGYGHSFGVLCHYYGREAGLELREDCDTVLEPGMVVSMEPMITIPNHLPGAGGYREHDILVITEEGNRNITGFPYGPEH
jgi:creatinase